MSRGEIILSCSLNPGKATGTLMEFLSERAAAWLVLGCSLQPVCKSGRAGG